MLFQCYKKIANILINQDSEQYFEVPLFCCIPVLSLCSFADLKQIHLFLAPLNHDAPLI